MRRGAGMLIAIDRRAASLGQNDSSVVASEARGECAAASTWGARGVVRFLPGSSDGSSTATRTREYTVLGKIRLDNRAQVRAMLADSKSGATDLDIAALLIEQRGLASLRDLLGTFALVIWHRPTGELWAARDAFGLETLYWRVEDDAIVFSSWATHLVASEGYDLDFVTAFLLRGTGCRDRSIFQRVQAIPPATIVRFGPRGPTAEQYWSAHDLTIETPSDVAEAASEFRRLLEHAVASSCDAESPVWAELSGGLDSSSVVAVAQSLVERGILATGVAGTTSYVDSMGAGDEREYSQAILERWSVRNTEFTDYWLWKADGTYPPITDQPDLTYPFYARHRRVAETLRSRGSHVLLSGQGPDHYLGGNLLFLADLFAQFHWRALMRGARDWAAASRMSLWHILAQHALRPLVPRSRLLRHHDDSTWPLWLTHTASERLNAEIATPAAKRFGGPVGRKYFGAIVSAVENLSWDVRRGALGELVEVRYPYLYRPLVELCLRLPPHLRSRPGQSKVVLRAAVKEVVPEAVRLRPSKGRIDMRLAWSLHEEEHRINALLESSRLEQLGCVQFDRFRSAVKQAQLGDRLCFAQVLPALALETWFAVTERRWTL